MSCSLQEQGSMETVRILVLAGMRPRLQRRLYEAQQEAARVWTVCRDLHLAARQHHTRWPDRDDLQQATKGQFALHSQTVQMITPCLPRQCGDGSRTAHHQSQDPLSLQGQALLSAVLACAGGECGTRAHRAADGTWASVPRVQAGSAGAPRGLQAGLEGRL